MIHDLELTDKLSGFPRIKFDDHVFRVTGRTVDPTAASRSSGRWAPSGNGDGGFPVLYTSIQREAALAEVVSYLVELKPMPTKPLVVHELAVTTSQTLNLVRADLSELGVDLSRYGERNYIHTQKIGAALNFLGVDGLITPSARWDGDNLTIFPENHSLNERLQLCNSEEIDWQAWAREAGFIQGDAG